MSERKIFKSDGEEYKFYTLYSLKIIITSVICAFLFIYFICETVSIEGTSMLPAMSNRDRILLDKVTYYLRKPSLGDIIVFKNPQNVSQRYIKRVVAKGGQRIKILDNCLYIDDKIQDEPYLYETLMSDLEEVLVPENYFFVLGDNRNNSRDSRELGCISSKLIESKAAFRIYPIKHIGRVR